MLIAVLLVIAAIVFALMAMYCGTNYRGDQAVATCLIACLIAFVFLGVSFAFFDKANTRSNAQWQVEELRKMGFNQVRYNSTSDTASGTLSGELTDCRVDLYLDSSYDEDTDESSSQWLLDSPPGGRLKPVVSASEVSRRPEVLRWCKSSKQ